MINGEIFIIVKARATRLSLIQRATLLFPLPLLVGARSIFLFSLFFSFFLTSSNKLMHLCNRFPDDLKVKNTEDTVTIN